MKILYLFTSSEFSEYIADYLLYGLRKNGHFVLDYPKREKVYSERKTPKSSVDSSFHSGLCGTDPIENRNNINISKFDLIIAENAGIFFKIFKFWKKKSNQDLLKTIFSKEKPIICLLTNDVDGRPLPNLRLNKKGIKMAIREKCLQKNNINIPSNDFPLFFMVKEENCKYVPPLERTEGVFFSMRIYKNTRERREFSNYFINNYSYKSLDEYFKAIRKHKYGISIFAGGLLCQRDPELGGNTLLCRMRINEWISPEFDYKNGKNCIEFWDIKDLREKIDYYNDNLEEYEKILKECYNHTIEFFTASAQSKRLIEWGKKQFSSL
jgi:hypothetical protein